MTGRGRLSSRQAEALFSAAFGGWTLHQLRHSALTHLAEANVALPLLMAKSRHVSLRSLQRSTDAQNRICPYSLEAPCSASFHTAGQCLSAREARL